MFHLQRSQQKNIGGKSRTDLFNKVSSNLAWFDYVLKMMVIMMTKLISKVVKSFVMVRIKILTDINMRKIRKMRMLMRER